MDIKNVKLEIYVPEEYVEKIRDALADIGVGQVGEYSHVVSYQKTKGYWKPLENSNPYSGKRGEICFGNEVKMETLCGIEKAAEAMRIIKGIHPYEEPVIHIVPLLDAASCEEIEASRGGL